MRTVRIPLLFLLLTCELLPADSWRDSLNSYVEKANEYCTLEDEFCQISGRINLGLRNIDTLVTLNHALSYEDIAILKAKIAMVQLNFNSVEKYLFTVKKRYRGDDWYQLYYQWLELTENYARWEKISHSFYQSHWRRPSPLHHIFYARFLVTQFRFDEAASILKQTIPETMLQKKEFWLTEAALAEARYCYAAADSIYQLLNRNSLTDADIIADQGNCLIRMSRVSDAITSYEFALSLNPYQELAHYMLGNGYTRHNYSELMKKYPKHFVMNSAVQDSFLWVKQILNHGRTDSACQFLLQWTDPEQEFVEPFVYLGALDWEKGDYFSALEYFQKALSIVPEYGRAHNGVAKALEGLRLHQSVYYRADERKFLHAKMPDVAGIDSYIINWYALSPRIQKRVAMSVKPWEHIIPVLVASESRHYIKPLYEQLSESPGLESLKDQRIDYDSRLWDDVRGAGGFTTVTGIEDVERMIFHRYNTIIHEMTHQVHAILTPEEKEHIESIYQHAAEMEKEGHSPFISRYQKASVWEYLAEGVNALASPRRDEYDVREIVRERLFEKDTALVHLAERYLLNMTDVTPFYPVAFANAISDCLENADTLGVHQFIDRADSLGYSSKDLTEAKIYSLQIFGDYQKADSLIGLLCIKYADQASVWHYRLESAVLQQQPLVPLLDSLYAMKSNWSRQQQLEADLILAEYYQLLSDYNRVANAATDALDKDDDNEIALWQKAIALWKLKQFKESDQFFRQVIARRNGIPELRGDYAEMLLEWGKSAEADQQLDEMIALNPFHASTLTISALHALSGRDSAEAIAVVQQGLAEYPYDLNLRRLSLRLGSESRAESLEWLAVMMQKLPFYVYDERAFAYTRVNDWDDTFRNEIAGMKTDH